MNERISSPESNLKLTAKGKKLLAVGALLGAGVVGHNAVEAAQPPQCEVVGTHTLMPGETVWGDVAQPLNDGSESLNQTMTEIKSVNPDLDLGHSLQAGVEINIPGSCK